MLDLQPTQGRSEDDENLVGEMEVREMVELDEEDWDEDRQELLEELQRKQITATPGQARVQDEEEAVLEEIAQRLMPHKSVCGIKGALEARDVVEDEVAQQYRQKLMEEFGDSALSGVYLMVPPVRGPFGEAEIWLKPTAVPVVSAPYQLSGE